MDNNKFSDFISLRHIFFYLFFLYLELDASFSSMRFFSTTLSITSYGYIILGWANNFKYFISFSTCLSSSLSLIFNFSKIFIVTNSFVDKCFDISLYQIFFFKQSWFSVFIIIYYYIFNCSKFNPLNISCFILFYMKIRFCIKIKI